VNLNSNWDDGIFAVTQDPLSGTLYVGGRFTTVPCNNVAKQGVGNNFLQAGSNGGNFSTSGANALYGVTSMAFHPVTNELYVAGYFTQPVSHLAKLVNNTWVRVTGVPINGNVHAIAFHPTTHLLYMAGEFTSPGSHIANFDTTGWESWNFPTDAGTAIYSFGWHPVSGELYVGGLFDIYGGIAKYSGGRWLQVGNGLGEGASVNSLSFDSVAPHTLYVGGSLAQVQNVARYDPDQDYWFSLASGTDTDVDTVFANNGSVFVGGFFSSPYLGIARFSGTDTDTTKAESSALLYGYSVGLILTATILAL